MAVALDCGCLDILAIFMENRPDYVIAWLAASKLGAVSALINTNLRTKALLHCISVSTAKILLFGSELTDAVEEVLDTLSQNGAAGRRTG